MIHGDLCHHESSFCPDISSVSTLSTTTTRRDRMNSTRPLSHGLMFGVCVLVGSLFAVGARASSAFADPQPDPNRTAPVLLGEDMVKTMKPGSCGKRLWKRPSCPGPTLVLPVPIKTWVAGKAGGYRRFLNWRVWWILPCERGPLCPWAIPLPTLRRTYIGRQRRWQAIRTAHGSSFSTPAR